MVFAVVMTFGIVGSGLALLFAVRKQSQRSAVLAKLKPGVRALRLEHAAGDIDGTPAGRGVLALYADELIFARVDAAVVRVDLAAITDVTRIRSVGSLTNQQNDRFDLGGHARAPEWMLKVEWKADGRTVSGAWATADAEDWIVALAAAR